MTETTPAERSAAFDDALQNAGHALMLPDPVPAMARVLTAFRDEYRAELLAAATVPASAPTDRVAACSCGQSPDPGICPVEHNGYKAGGHCVCAHDGKPLPATTGTGLRDLLVDTLTSYFANFSDEESARINAGEAAGAVLVRLLGAIPSGIDVASWTAIRAIQLMNEAGEQTEAYRLALSQALGLGTGANWEAIRDRGRDVVAEVAELTQAVRRAASGPGGAAGETQQDEPEALPLLFWDEPAGVVYEDGRITAWLSKAVSLAQSVPAGQLILRPDAGARLRRALTTALGAADDAREAAERTAANCRDAEGCHRVIPCDPGCAARWQPAAVAQPDGEA